MLSKVEHEKSVITSEPVNEVRSCLNSILAPALIFFNFVPDFLCNISRGQCGKMASIYV